MVPSFSGGINSAPRWEKIGAGYVTAIVRGDVAAVKAATDKNVQELWNIGEPIDQACESCHLEFWYPGDKPLVWLHGEIKTPPFSAAARVEAGVLLRLLQQGETLGLPHSRPMPSIGPRCHELRIRDVGAAWRIVYRLDEDAVVLVEVFSKKTEATPQNVIKACRRRLRVYDKVKED